MPAPDPTQWRIFNVLLRLLGLGATFSGVVATVTIGFGVPAPYGQTPVTNWPTVVAGLVVSLLGLGFLMIPAFRPDLGDTTVVRNPFRAWSDPKRRTWWTGDEIPPPRG
jgi:hypothetical protein